MIKNFSCHYLLMYIYNKAIICELDNNIDYIKVEINQNEIICQNKIVLKDIKSKLKINVENVFFYVSVYDYNLKEADYYWDNIKNLPKEELPIYLKNSELNEYLEWLNKNFNNNKIDIYIIKN